MIIKMTVSLEGREFLSQIERNSLARELESDAICETIHAVFKEVFGKDFFEKRPELNISTTQDLSTRISCVLQALKEVNSNVSKDFLDENKPFKIIDYKAIETYVNTKALINYCFFWRIPNFTLDLLNAAVHGHIEMARLILAHSNAAQIPINDHPGLVRSLNCAVQNKNTEIAIAILDYDKDNNFNSKSLSIVLHSAILENNLIIFNRVLNHPNAVYISANTEGGEECGLDQALVLAAIHNKIEIVTALLNHQNADQIRVAGRVNSLGCALVYAARNGNIEIVQRILQHPNAAQILENSREKYDHESLIKALSEAKNAQHHDVAQKILDFIIAKHLR